MGSDGEAGVRRAGDVLPVLILGFVEIQMLAVAGDIVGVPEHEGGGEDALTL